MERREKIANSLLDLHGIVLIEIQLNFSRQLNSLTFAFVNWERERDRERERERRLFPAIRELSSVVMVAVSQLANLNGFVDVYIRAGCQSQMQYKIEYEQNPSKWTTWNFEFVHKIEKLIKKLLIANEWKL